MSQPEAFVYSWRNKTSGQRYVGYHKGTEDDGYVCSSQPMMEDYKKDPSNFERFIIAHGTTKDMRGLEHVILVALNAKDDPEFYNRSNGTTDFVLKHTPESKAKIGEANRGRKRTPEQRALMSAKQKARFARSRPPSKLIGRKLSEETKAKLRVACRGWHHSPESIAKFSGTRNRHCPPERRQYFRSLYTGVKLGAEHSIKIKAGLARSKLQRNTNSHVLV